MRCAAFLSLLLGGCSLVVPGPDSFEYRDERDGGSVDASPGADANRSCDGGLVTCGECVDVQSDPSNCGDCGNACGMGASCDSGACSNPIVEVSAGLGHACVRQAAGEVWCWGRNATGELGDGTALDRVFPVRSDALGISSAVAAGGVVIRAPGGALTFEGFTCSIDRSGRLRCLGGNGAGQLGDGTTEMRLEAADVVGVGQVSAVVLGGFGLARTQEERLVRWGGYDAFSEMVLPAEEARPSGFAGAWLASMTSGAGHWCAASTGGGVYCWGRSTSGALGLGSAEEAERPTRVSGLENGAHVSASLSSSCALLGSGTVLCWGRSDALGAGLSTTDAHPEPIEVSGMSNASQLAASAWGTQTCAVHGPDRRVSCWGRTPVPERVGRLTGVMQVTLGGSLSTEFGCALLEAGGVQCWGNNAVGQLGDGTTESRSEPAEVVGLPTGE